MWIRYLEATIKVDEVLVALNTREKRKVLIVVNGDFGMAAMERSGKW